VATSASHRFVVLAFFSIDHSCCVKTTVLPSGDSSGLPRRLIAHRSCGVMTRRWAAAGAAITSATRNAAVRSSLMEPPYQDDRSVLRTWRAARRPPPATSEGTPWVPRGQILVRGARTSPERRQEREPRSPESRVGAHHDARGRERVVVYAVGLPRPAGPAAARADSTPSGCCAVPGDAQTALARCRQRPQAAGGHARPPSGTRHAAPRRRSSHSVTIRARSSRRSGPLRLHADEPAKEEAPVTIHPRWFHRGRSGRCHSSRRSGVLVYRREPRLEVPRTGALLRAAGGAIAAIIAMERRHATRRCRVTPTRPATGAMMEPPPGSAGSIAPPAHESAATLAARGTVTW